MGRGYVRDSSRASVTSVTASFCSAAMNAQLAKVSVISVESYR